MYKTKPENISLENAKKVLDFLLKNRFLTVYFTGGEPTLHPDIVDIVRYANGLGLVTSMTTNGTSSTKTVEELKEAGLYLLSVSLDHWDAGKCENIRGYRGVKHREEEVIKFGKDIGLRIYALAYLNPDLIHDGIEVFMRYVNHRLGVPFGFCYPTESSVNTYRLNGRHYVDGELNVKLREAIQAILSLKRQGFGVANVETYVEDILRFFENSAPNFYCRGGEDVVYIDWLGDVYPCFLRRKLFNLLRGGETSLLKNVRCNECLISCFREPSILPEALASPKLLLKEARYSFDMRSMIA